VLRLNRRLLDTLSAIHIEKEPDKALGTYIAYEKRRSATYMHYARPDAPTLEQAYQSLPVTVDLSLDEGEGYAGVALDLIEAFETGEPVHIALNVPNRGAIDCILPGDVVEVSCVVDRNGIHPQPIGVVPEPQELLMRAVKLYERRTVEAILDRSRQKAYLALMAHPLVLSYSRAQVLVDEYLEAHAPFVGEWI
jgi:6-phospho-beta-glucosidase